MGNEIDDLLALYIEHESILTTLYLAGILEDDEWDVIKIFLDDPEALENIRAVQNYIDPENEAPEASERSSQSTKQGAEGEEKKSSASKSDSESAQKTEDLSEPTSDVEYIAHRVNGLQWLKHPSSSDKK